MRTLFTTDLAKVHAHSFAGVPVSTRERSYPIVLMRAGGSSLALDYTTLAEDLASHGYVVVGIDAPYRTRVVVLPNGRTIERTPENNPETGYGATREQRILALHAAWTADLRFALDRLAALNAADPSGRFTGRLDLAHVGAFGHSFGGATVAQLCHDDPRCRAAVDLDGAVFGSAVTEGFRQPFLLLLGDHRRDSDPDKPRILADLQSLYDRLPAGTRQRLTIDGANHFLFSDNAIVKSQIVLGGLHLVGVMRLDGRRQLAITVHCLHTFFDAHLKSSATTDVVTPVYPELHPIK